MKVIAVAVDLKFDGLSTLVNDTIPVIVVNEKLDALIWPLPRGGAVVPFRATAGQGLNLGVGLLQQSGPVGWGQPGGLTRKTPTCINIDDKVCQQAHIPVHGIIWLLDQVYATGVMSAAVACEKIKRLELANPRLPRLAIQERVRRWCGK